MRGAWAGGKQVGTVEADEMDIGLGSGVNGGKDAGEETEIWDYGVDDKRGWVIGGAWLLVAAVE
jgi:hypothetical protein